MRARHALGLAALVFLALGYRATEQYTTRYQSLPVLDWLESRPPLDQARDVPAAADLARGLLRSAPLLVIRDDVRPLRLVFSPPMDVQRTVGGVRDAARIQLAAPGSYKPDEIPIQARLDVIVFNRALRAAAWSDLNAVVMDGSDPFTGMPQVRVAGSDAGDHVWLIAPRAGGGMATVAGARGPVGYLLQVTYQRPDAATPEDRIDLSARAEATARQVAADWSGWVQSELARLGVAS